MSYFRALNISWLRALQFGAVPNIMQRWGGGLPPAMPYAGMPGLPQTELPPLQGGAADRAAALQRLPLPLQYRLHRKQLLQLCSRHGRAAAAPADYPAGRQRAANLVSRWQHAHRRIAYSQRP